MSHSTVEQYIKELPSPQQDIVSSLCEIIRNTTPDMQDSIKWDVPVFSINRNTVL